MSQAPNPLPMSFYDRDVIEVAQGLLGKRLVRASRRGVASGVIVEVEAYRGADDPASHAYRGRTRRNASMFGPPGRAYVYTIHAKFCLNAIGQPDQRPCGVLIRGVEPERGLALMSRRRGCERAVDLTRGPARLCQALDVDRGFDGWDLTLGKRLWIEEHDGLDEAAIIIASSSRIGVTSAQDKLWRFFLDGNRFVSGPRGLHTRPTSELLGEASASATAR